MILIIQERLLTFQSQFFGLYQSNTEQNNISLNCASRQRISPSAVNSSNNRRCSHWCIQLSPHTLLNLRHLLVLFTVFCVFKLRFDWLSHIPDGHFLKLSDFSYCVTRHSCCVGCEWVWVRSFTNWFYSDVFASQIVEWLAYEVVLCLVYLSSVCCVSCYLISSSSPSEWTRLGTCQPQTSWWSCPNPPTAPACGNR